MKLYIPFRYCLFISFIFCSIFAFGQTPIDSVISIKFPGKVENYKLENEIGSVRGLYYNSEKESYILFKTTLLTNGEGAQFLPANAAGLTDIYHHDIANQIASVIKKGFVFKDSAKIKIEGYIAYKLKFADQSGNPGAESILLFLNGVTYAIIYSKVSTYSEKNKNDFLNSLRVAHSESIKQIVEPDDFTIFNFVLTAIIILGLGTFFIRASKNKSKFGINLKRVYCPVCNTKQPIIRIPRNGNQFLYGGTTCPKCHANVDKYGNLIS